MDDATREELLDKRIQRRLATDSAYRNAENAEEQAEREREIEESENDFLDHQLHQNRTLARDPYARGIQPS